MEFNSIHPAVQMQLNFWAVAKLRVVDSLVQLPFLVESNVVFFRPWSDDDFERRMEQLQEVGDLVALLLDPVKQHHGPSATLSLRGRLPGGLLGDQWIKHESEDGAFWEFDIDDGSPVDLTGLVAHAKQVLEHKRKGTHTDPLEIAMKLREGGLEV